jgi:tRNA isopentenyl-2-thiomethyl-A-37 hydroxylase MiaE
MGNRYVNKLYTSVKVIGESYLPKINLNKSVIPRSDSKYGQDLIDKMVLLIKEELHHFYQVLEMMEHYGIEYKSIRA